MKPGDWDLTIVPVLEKVRQENCKIKKKRKEYPIKHKKQTQQQKIEVWKI